MAGTRQLWQTLFQYPHADRESHTRSPPPLRIALPAIPQDVKWKCNRGEHSERVIMTVHITGAPYYLVTGGTPLHGEVTISGAKNAVSKMIMASLLTTEQCVLRNVPLLGDLDLTVKLCQGLGSEVSQNLPRSNAASQLAIAQERGVEVQLDDH